MFASKHRLSIFVALTAVVPLAAASLQTVAAAADHPNLSGFWEPRAGSVQNRHPLSFTAAGEAEAKKPNKLTNPNGIDVSDTNCLPLGQPWDLYQSAPIDIVQDARETTMMYEDRSLPWHIYTDGRHHPEKAHLNGTLNGNSIGHWEGDEFIVDSVGFASRAGHGALMIIPNNATTHLIERFRLSADGKQLHAHFIIDDPKWLTKPNEFDVTWYRDAPSEYAIPTVCDARDNANAHY